MSRRLRIHIPGGCYHVTLRGNHRQAIFRDAADRSALDAIARVAADRTGTRILSYCWMTNHIHLLARVGQEPLARLMQMIGSRYARYLQRSVGTTGHLFERRYHAVLVRDEHQLIHVVRYLHLNPIRAGLVAEPGDYAWSSHRQYLGLRAAPWVWADGVLRLLAADVDEARRAFAQFCGDALRDPGCMSIARELLSGEADGPNVVPGRRPTAPRTLDHVIADVCATSGLQEADLAGPGRGHVLTALRGEVAARAAEEGCASLTDVARRLNRHLSSISRAAERWRRLRSGESCKNAIPVPLEV